MLECHWLHLISKVLGNTTSTHTECVNSFLTIFLSYSLDKSASSEKAIYTLDSNLTIRQAPGQHIMHSKLEWVLGLLHAQQSNWYTGNLI